VLIAGAAVAIAAAAYVARNSFAPPTTAIVVIPQGDEYAIGLGEVVSAELARNREVHVVAWPLVTEYLHQQSPANIGAAAKKFHADAALVINVTRRDDRLRIAALIMRPEQGMKDWVGEYERGTNDVFAVQREIARTIADEAGRAISRLN
jgi:TolB-like protein